MKFILGTLRTNDADDNENLKKQLVYKQNNNFASATRFFVHFFARFCTTTMWKYLISRFTETKTSIDEILFLFLNLAMAPKN